MVFLCFYLRCFSLRFLIIGRKTVDNSVEGIIANKRIQITIGIVLFTSLRVQSAL
jgi:hypothetical protein